ncbi:MAG: hypothetical protein JXN62_11220 [Bacteroidales bacterium]|nr:hypothetical protein [Bacteroidales bacterium]
MVRALFILLLSLPISTFAQIKYIGTPRIRNFPKSEYNAGTQNWSIIQDKDGFIYFANNDGLLCYNGVEWDLTRISFSSPLRSIMADSQNTIYAGLINDFGIIYREAGKASEFKSLKNLVPEGYKEFDDIWRIYEVDEGIVFQCYKYIFLYKDEKIEVIEPENRYHFSYKIGNRLLIQDPGIGLFEFRNGKMEILPWWQKNPEKEISAILETEDNNILIGTSHNGIYILENGQLREWNTPVNQYVIKNGLFCAAIIPGNYYAFGTILNGLIISDAEGNIVNILNADAGIQNNTVLSLCVDRANNLWLGLDNGIDYVETNSPLSYIGSGKIGTGYCCKVFEGNLYLGTNQGLYVTPFDSFSSEAGFTLVENTAGQVWTLEEFDGQLLCGHNKGTFIIHGLTAENIGTEEGAWKYVQLKDDPELLVAGHYQGLSLFRKINNQWTFYKKVKGFEESCRHLYQDQDGYIWIGHSGRGIFRLRLNKNEGIVADIVRYTDRQGLTSSIGNILLKYGEDIFVATNKGSLEYDKGSDTFKPSGRIDEIFGDAGKLKALAADNDGNLWFIADSASGYVRRNEDMTYTRIVIPFRKLYRKYVNEFEFIYPYDSKNIFIGLEDGFAHYAPLIPKPYNEKYKAFITKVELPYIDSVLHLTTADLNAVNEFPYRNNSFRFQFAAPFFENEAPLEFSYLLEGFTDKWSHWTTDKYKDFAMLHEGTYTIRLKSRNIYGVESEPASFSFKIMPPWKRSTTAYLLYMALSFGLIFLIIRYILYRVRQSSLRQEEKHRLEIKEREDKYQREALISEKEIIKLRNEKLQHEMTFRNKELANQTLGIINKNKFLKKVNEDLNSIQDFVVNDAAKAKILGLKNRVKKEIDLKHQNKIFESYFDQANEEFFKRLKEKYPDLTPYDLRLCAFIRMNISTKEISTILNISYRGAEVSRYRLRKKMDLPREINLASHLAGF